MNRDAVVNGDDNSSRRNGGVMGFIRSIIWGERENRDDLNGRMDVDDGEKTDVDDSCDSTVVKEETDLAVKREDVGCKTEAENDDENMEENPYPQDDLTSVGKDEEHEQQVASPEIKEEKAGPRRNLRKVKSRELRNLSIAPAPEKKRITKRETKTRAVAVNNGKKIAPQATSRYACSICRKTYKKEGTFNLHVGVHCNQNQPKPWECPECDICCASYRKLCSHVDAKHNPNPLNCQFCGKKFGNQDGMSKHQNYDASCKTIQLAKVNATA